MENLTNLLILKGYNNYFNRIIKREQTIAAYKAASESYHDIVNINFNPNDGVTTSIIVNVKEDISQSDYLIVYDFSLSPQYQLMSRWFILSADRLRSGQYKLSLKRDLIAEHFDNVIQAPCYINKATIRDYTNPLIFNNEGMTFNQIKKSETLLKDNSKCAWVALYLTEDINANVTIDPSLPIFETIQTPIAQWQYNYSTTPYTKDIRNINLGVMVNTNVEVDYNRIFNYNDRCEYVDYEQLGLGYNPSLRFKYNSGLTQAQKPYYLNDFISQDWDDIIAAIKTDINYNQNYSQLLQYDGKIIKDSDNKIWRVSLRRGNLTTATRTYLTSSSSSYGLLSATIAPSGTLRDKLAGSINNQTFSVEYNYSPIYTDFELISTSASLSFDTRSLTKTKDEVYNIVMIPYYTEGQLKAQLNAQAKDIMGPNDVLNFVNCLYNTEGVGDKIKDIQLLPYTPMQDYITTTTSGNTLTLNLTAIPSTYLYEVLSGDNLRTVVLAVPRSSFTFDINTSISVPRKTGNSIALDYKIANECDMYRLTSPNYNGQFEFSVAKNDGVQYFNVDCSYKPVNPYIHINPNFNRLYGQDFNDARGLICGGDFSLSLKTDAWIQYQNQNKNYQNIFDRQIQNMDYNNKLSNIAAGINFASQFIGTVANTASAAANNKFSAQAAVGSATGLITSASSIILQRKAQAESRDYTIDMFNYQLGNIKALPDSLTKVSALNYNNKIFPMVEYYSCSDQEKTALENKLKYNGMTVMSIGKIEDYLQDELTWIQGTIIRIEGVKETTNILQEISREISMGVFMND